MEKLEKNILDISNNYYKYLMNLENVNGVGVGLKRINGILTKEPCIHVLVEEKVNENNLTKNNIIPKTYMGIKTDVIKRGKLGLHKGVNSDFKLRPLQGGCAISIRYPKFNDFDDITGTLGCIVMRKKRFKKEYFILSNNHVIGASNDAPIGNPILQPQYESGKEEEVAYLSNFIKIEFASFFNEPSNYADAAIAKVKNKTLISNKIFGLGRVNGSKSILNLSLEELDKINLKKVGMRTGLTKGKIISIGVTEETWFNNNTFRAIFKNVIVSDMFSRGGDSGSCVLNDNNEVIGILSQGTDTDTSIHDINTILKDLKVEIYTGKK